MFVSQPLASTLATARQGEQLGERGMLSGNQRPRIGLNARSQGLGRMVKEELVASSGLSFYWAWVLKRAVKAAVGRTSAQINQSILQVDDTQHFRDDIVGRNPVQTFNVLCGPHLHPALYVKAAHLITHRDAICFVTADDDCQP